MGEPSNGGGFPEKASEVCITADVCGGRVLRCGSHGNPSRLKTSVAPVAVAIRRPELYAEHSDSFCR